MRSSAGRRYTALRLREDSPGIPDSLFAFRIKDHRPLAAKTPIVADRNTQDEEVFIPWWCGRRGIIARTAHVTGLMLTRSEQLIDCGV
jgi:hypothetical protein